MKKKGRKKKTKETKEIEKTFTELEKLPWYKNRHFYTIIVLLLIIGFGSYIYFDYNQEKYANDRAVIENDMFSPTLQSTLTIFMGILIFLIPLLMTGLTIYSFRKDKVRLLKYLGKSIPIYAGIYIFIGLLMFVFEYMIQEVFINDQRGRIVQITALSIALLITIFFSIRSYIKDFYTDFKLSTLFIPVVLVLMIRPLIDIVDESNQWVVLASVLGIFALGFITSLVFIIIYSRTRNRQLFWTTISYFVFNILVLIAVGIKEKVQMYNDRTIILAVVIVSLLIPLNYLINSMDLISIRSKTAIPTIFLSFVTISPALLWFMYLY